MERQLEKMEDVASMIKSALERKKWSVKKAAEEIGVERTFLGRLRSGGRPPKLLRAGRASSDKPDERYRRIAKVLDLNEERFLAAVAGTQASASSRTASAVGETRSRGPHRLILAELLRTRYPQLAAIVSPPTSFKGHTRILDIAGKLLESRLPPEESRYWRHRLRTRNPMADSWWGIEHGHLGQTHAVGMRGVLSADARLCISIANELTRGSTGREGDSAVGSSALNRRTELARFFYEVGLCCMSGGE